MLWFLFSKNCDLYYLLKVSGRWVSQDWGRVDQTGLVIGRGDITRVTGSQVRSFILENMIVMETRDYEEILTLLQVILKVKNLVSVLESTLIHIKLCQVEKAEEGDHPLPDQHSLAASWQGNLHVQDQGYQAVKFKFSPGVWQWL